MLAAQALAPTLLPTLGPSMHSRFLTVAGWVFLVFRFPLSLTNCLKGNVPLPWGSAPSGPPPTHTHKTAVPAGAATSLRAPLQSPSCCLVSTWGSARATPQDGQLPAPTFLQRRKQSALPHGQSPPPPPHPQPLSTFPCQLRAATRGHCLNFSKTP